MRHDLGILRAQFRIAKDAAQMETGPSRICEARCRFLIANQSNATRTTPRSAAALAPAVPRKNSDCAFVQSRPQESQRYRQSAPLPRTKGGPSNHGTGRPRPRTGRNDAPRGGRRGPTAMNCVIRSGTATRLRVTRPRDAKVFIFVALIRNAFSRVANRVAVFVICFCGVEITLSDVRPKKGRK